jgi:hypothetical protein
MTNSRMKDFFDLLAFSRQFTFDGPALIAAIRATFTRRGTSITALPPIAVSDEFVSNVGKQAEWRGFLKRNKLERTAITLEAVVVELRTFLLPLMDALVAGAEYKQTWTPDGRWHSRTG